MSRYIDADKLVSVMCHHCTEYEQCTDKNGGCDDFDMLMIAHAPTADVVERKRGKWIETESGMCKCSECDIYNWIIFGRNVLSNYCSHCGADMRGDKYE